jgi:hypothetical protein
MQHEDTIVHRLELFHAAQHVGLALQLRKDIATVSPETVVNLITMDTADPWDFGEVYAGLYDWARGYNCARRTRACCSSTRSASSGSTSRRCCSRPSKRSASCRWAATARSAATSS